MMLCEVAAYYKLKGMTLCDAMQDMYKEYGYYKEGLFTITKKGIDGAEQIENMMREKRENPATVMGGFTRSLTSSSSTSHTPRPLSIP